VLLLLDGGEWDRGHWDGEQWVLDWCGAPPTARVLMWADPRGPEA
jgi:hypothetical protein